MDSSPPGSSVYGISQARILEWVAIPFSRGSPWPRDQTRISCIGRQILYHWAPRVYMPSFKSSEILFIPSCQWNQGFSMMEFALEVTRVQRIQALSPSSLQLLFFVMVHRLTKRKNYMWSHLVLALIHYLASLDIFKGPRVKVKRLQSSVINSGSWVRQKSQMTCVLLIQNRWYSAGQWRD